MSTRFLLDTQAFLFAASERGGLSPKARAALLHRQTDVYLSLISLWEMQIQLALGKLRLPVSLQTAVQRAVTDLGLELLPLQAEHVDKLADLPFHHRDPFDRLLIAQALYEQMPILGNDTAFDGYGVKRVW